MFKHLLKCKEFSLVSVTTWVLFAWVFFFGYRDFTFLSFGASLALFSALFSLNCSGKNWQPGPLDCNT